MIKIIIKTDRTEYSLYVSLRTMGEVILAKLSQENALRLCQFTQETNRDLMEIRLNALSKNPRPGSIKLTVRVKNKIQTVSLTEKELNLFTNYTERPIDADFINYTRYLSFLKTAEPQIGGSLTIDGKVQTWKGHPYLVGVFLKSVGADFLIEEGDDSVSLRLIAGYYDCERYGRSLNILAECHRALEDEGLAQFQRVKQNLLAEKKSAEFHINSTINRTFSFTVQPEWFRKFFTLE